MKDIYPPAEDSIFLAEFLRQYLKNKNKKLKILDMGTGSGIIAETAKKENFKNIVAADINKKAVDFTRKKQIKAIASDLFSNIKGKFDIITFNPPYLPSHPYDSEIDTTGGKKGYETIFLFLKQARNHLREKGEILLLFSSLSKPEAIKKQARKLNYQLRVLSRKKLFFEELFICRLKRKINP